MPSDDVRHINIDIKKSPLEDNSVPRSILRKITHCEVRYVSCYTYPKKKTEVYVRITIYSRTQRLLISTVKLRGEGLQGFAFSATCH